ncbi:MAG: alpha/beta fold hydrolase [Nitrosopumilus sp.]|nr:alpha/beta fold hydrolase [Nitrosopumilus sp.]MDH3832667.1 alpha/beta fold hydrolase [Nitrosopumilus sp.]
MQYGLALFRSWSKAIESASNLQESTGKKIQDEIRSIFDVELKNTLQKTDFSKSLSDLVGSFTELALVGYHDKLYRYLETMIRNYDNSIEPIRDSINRTPSEIIPMKAKFEVHHYKTDSPQKFKTPILVVGSLINRHYILDLLPERSVIRYFQQLGFDVYATDWRMPTIKDENMSLASYAHDYLENAVDKVEEITGSRNVTLFGYCWGGILSLIYTALHPENVKNLILHATPADFGKSPTILESWIKDLDVKKFVKTFGNIPSSFLNIAFILRNPLEAALKYQFYFGQPRSTREIMQFFAVESWLYDSVPIIGKVFEQIINDIYKKNLLIQNKMMLGENIVDLKKITMPVLNIVGTNDDLVSAESSRSITDVVSSKDKKTLEFPIGHVGLCISKTAHKKLWPEVGKWLREHSS